MYITFLAVVPHSLNNQPSVLPPIFIPPQSSTHQPHPPTQPPTYEQADTKSRGQSARGADSKPPDYYQLSGHDVRDGGQEGGREEEEEDYISNEEIHVAAMEGVKASTMKRLVRELST